MAVMATKVNSTVGSNLEKCSLVPFVTAAFKAP